MLSRSSFVLFNKTFVYLYCESQSDMCFEIIFRFVIYSGGLYK